MPKTHTIAQGDSVSRIAELHGLAPTTIWDDPSNKELRALRSRADVLLPGDVLTVPERRDKRLKLATGARHRFRRLGVPMLFELQLFDAGGNPLSDREWQLDVDGTEYHGRTDANGYFRQYISNGAQQGRLVIDDAIDRVLFFGHLDPIDTVTGVQKRLTNMGFECAGDDGNLGRATLIAVRQFQRLAGLPVTGEIDAATRDEVRRAHDDSDRLRTHLDRQPGAAG
jgi:hypothetical protein